AARRRAVTAAAGRRRAATAAGCLEPQHVVHAVESRLAARRQPAGRGERAAREPRAVLRQMRKFQTLARTGKYQPVLAHDVASAQNTEADGAGAPCPGVAVPYINRRLV